MCNFYCTSSAPPSYHQSTVGYKGYAPSYLTYDRTTLVQKQQKATEIPQESVTLDALPGQPTD